MAKTKKAKNKISSERRIGVLIEHFDKKLDLVVEQHGDTNAKIGRMGKTLDSHTETMGGIKVDIEIIKTDIEFIKGGLRKKADLDDFIALERRVAALEKKK